jgi:hypothetical protein
MMTSPGSQEGLNYGIKNINNKRGELYDDRKET